MSTRVGASRRRRGRPPRHGGWSAERVDPEGLHARYAAIGQRPAAAVDVRLRGHVMPAVVAVVIDVMNTRSCEYQLAYQSMLASYGTDGNSS